MALETETPLKYDYVLTSDGINAVRATGHFIGSDLTKLRLALIDKLACDCHSKVAGSHTNDCLSRQNRYSVEGYTLSLSFYPNEVMKIA